MVLSSANSWLREITSVGNRSAVFQFLLLQFTSVHDDSQIGVSPEVTEWLTIGSRSLGNH